MANTDNGKYESKARNLMKRIALVAAIAAVGLLRGGAPGRRAEAAKQMGALRHARQCGGMVP